MSKYIAYEVNHNFFSELNEESAWVAGLLAADGHVSKDGTRIGISQSNDHGRDLIVKIKNLLEFQGKITETQPQRGGKVYTIRFTSYQIATDLNLLNVSNNKTLVYSYPDIDKNLDAAFIRGYIDGDGSIGVYNINNVRVLTLSLVGTEEFIKLVAQKVPAAGSSRRITSNGLFEIRWYGRHAVDAGLWIYNTSLPETKKYQIWKLYLEELEVTPPKWWVDRARKLKVLSLLDAGKTVKEVAKLTDESYKIVHKWSKYGKASRLV